MILIFLITVLFSGAMLFLMRPGFSRLCYIAYNFIYSFYYIFVPYLYLNGGAATRSFYVDIVASDFSFDYFASVIIYITIFNFLYFIFSLIFLKKESRALYKLSVTGERLIFICGIIGAIIFVIDQGGFANLLQNMYLMRSGVLEASWVSIIAKKLSVLLVFYYLISLNKWYRNSMSGYTVIVLSIFAILISYSSGGRGAIFWLVIYSSAINFYNLKLFDFKLILFVFLLLITYLISTSSGNTMSLIANLSEFNIHSLFENINLASLVSYILNETSFVSSSLLAALDYSESNGNPILFFQLDGYRSLTNLNTFLISGLDDKAVVPPGLLGFSFYNFGYVGLLIMPFFSAILLLLLVSFFNRIISGSNLFIIYSIVLFDTVLFLVVNFDFKVWLLRNAVICILISLFIIRGKSPTSTSFNFR